ncbi:MAG: hypothetical protein AAFQ13_00690 [Pseudomonadota bacterium]
MEPFEIIGAPLVVYIAPTGTAFPEIATAPSGDWTLLGKRGDRSIAEEGVTVSHSKTYSNVRTAGASGPVKAFLESEDLMLRMTLLDLSIESYANALNGNTVTTVAAGSGTAGYKSVGLSQSVGRTQEFALLARGLSPEDETMNLQYEFPRVYESASPEPVFRKGGQGAALALSFMALEDLAAATPQERFGRYRTQHQAALS